MDLNNEDILQGLRDAKSTKEGQYIIDFLKQNLAEITFEDIDTNQSFNEVGQRFLVVKSIREHLTKLTSFLEGL